MAYLVISGKATGGVMIGFSILFGRALAPVELAIAHWRSFVTARQGYGRLEEALVADPTEAGVRLPPPQATLVVEMRQIHSAIGAMTINPDTLSAAERLQYEGYLRREEANAAVYALAKKGMAATEIVRRTGQSRGLVRQILRG